MTTYRQLSKYPRKFLSMSGYTVEEFEALLPAFSARLAIYVQTHTLDGKKRKKRKYASYRNSPLPTVEDKLLFILIYLKKAPTQDIFGELFGMQQPVANKWIHRLHPILNQALADLEQLPERDATALNLEADTHRLYFHDGTERPINRPTDKTAQTTFYSGKKNNIRSRITSSSMPHAG